MFLPNNSFVCAHGSNGTNNVQIMNGMRRRTEITKMQRMYILNKMNGIYDNMSYFGSARKYGQNGVNGVNGLYKQHSIKTCDQKKYNTYNYYSDHPYAK